MFYRAIIPSVIKAMSEREPNSAERLVLNTFPTIEQRRWNDLLLTESVVLKDANIGPDEFAGRAAVVGALEEGFKVVKEISFEIVSFGQQKHIDERRGRPITVSVTTNTTTEFNPESGSEGVFTEPQVFNFDVVDGRISRIY